MMSCLEKKSREGERGERGGGEEGGDLKFDIFGLKGSMELKQSRKSPQCQGLYNLTTQKERNRKITGR
jgi:hypothetical protein